MKRELLTTFEASRKYGFSTGYLRVLMDKGVLNGYQAKISSKNAIWLIDEKSLKLYLSKERKPGPKPRKKRLR